MTPAMTPATTLPRIFVQIPSYRDRECQWTLRDMFERARHPGRVFAGVCWQTVPEEDADCFLARPHPAQVRTADFHIREARGLGWARAKAQALWQGEEYTLQIDSHMRFADDWDERMIAMLALCDSPDPVLTVYPASYDPPDRRENVQRQQVQRIKEFLPSGLLQFTTGVVPDEVPMDRPFPTAALAGGFVFGSSRIITDVPSDPGIYFLGEEPSLAVRLWTAGFDLFSPHETLLFHYYLRKDGSRLWDDVSSRTTHLLHERTMRRMRLLCEPSAFTPADLAELGAFGLGTHRSLEAYEAFAGMNFASRTLSAGARSYPFVRQPTAPAERNPPDTWVPALGTQLFVLGEEGVLFSEATGTMQRLNPAAAVTWCALEDGHGWQRIAHETAAARGIPIEAAWVDLRRLAAHWSAEGLLHDSAAEHVHAPRIDPARFDFRTRIYRLLDSVVQLRFGDDALEQLIHPAFAHLEVEPAGSTVTSPMLTVLRILEWYYVIDAGQGLMGPPATLRKLVPRLKAEFLARALKRQDHILHLHAASVLHEGRFILLPAASGSGKTLLTARLVSLGCTYLSDEAALLLRDGTLRPVPTALSVKSDGSALLAPHFPALPALPEHDREDGVTVRYLPPTPPGPRPPHPPLTVVFPRYVPGAATTLRPLAAPDALSRLLAECLAIPRKLTAATAATIVETIERASCWELVSGDLDDAAHQVMALPQHGPGASPQG